MQGFRESQGSAIVKVVTARTSLSDKCKDSSKSPEFIQKRFTFLWKVQRYQKNRIFRRN